MALSQSVRVVPPQSSDKQLVDYSGVVQRNLVDLFQAAHVHVGQRGVLTTFPTAKDGAVGDVLIAVVAGSAYLCFKTASTTWFRLGPATTI